MKKLLTLFVIIATLSTFFSAYATTYCSSDGVRVRSEPINGDNIIGKLKFGQEVNVLEQRAGWAKIEFKDGIGYVYEGYLQEKGTEWSGQKLGLTKKTTKMKKSLKSKKTTTIPENTIVLVTSTNNGVATIKYDGEDGYVKLSDLETKTLKNQTCVGTYTITFHQNDGIRSDNIRKSLRRLNGTKVKAGEKFSFFKVVGIDYEEASEYMEDDTSIGGGLCHVATTLKKALNSAQRNGCDIRFRKVSHFDCKTPYAKKNDEVKVSIDEKLDLTFTNRNSYAISIYALMRDDSVIVLICR